MRSNIYKAGEREACKEEGVVTGLGGRQEGIMSPPKRRGVVGKRFKMDNKRERERRPLDLARRLWLVTLANAVSVA